MYVALLFKNIVVPTKYKNLVFMEKYLWYSLSASSLWWTIMSFKWLMYKPFIHLNCAWHPCDRWIFIWGSWGLAHKYSTIIFKTSNQLIIKSSTSQPLIGRWSRHETSVRVRFISQIERWRNNVSEFHLSANPEAICGMYIYVYQKFTTSFNQERSCVHNQPICMLLLII